MNSHPLMKNLMTPIAGGSKGCLYGLRVLRCIAGACLVIAPLALRAQTPVASGTVITIAGKGLRGFSGDGGPATNAAFKYLTDEGYYAQNPKTAVAIGTLANGKQGEHTGGYRFGRWTEIRDYYHEEVEKALQGKQSAKEAIDNSIKRGNAALRAFEKTAATN